MIIGIDPHKMSHTANAVDPTTNTTAASVRVDASLAGYRELMRWSRQFPDRRWAVENAHGLGRHLAQWLVARGGRARCPMHRNRPGPRAVTRQPPQNRRHRRCCRSKRGCTPWRRRGGRR